VPSDINTQPFLLLRGEWDLKRSREILDQAFQAPGVDDFEHIVLEVGEPAGMQYYLLPPGLVYDRLRTLDESIMLADALDLAQESPISTITSQEAAQPHARPAIVIDTRGVVAVEGYPMQRGNGGTRGGGGPAAQPNGDDAEPENVTTTLVADFPSTVQDQKKAPLLVSLSTLVPHTPGATMDIPDGAPVDVLVQAKAGFEIVGSELATIEVTKGETEPVLFTLRANAAGDGDIRVTAFHHGTQVGMLRLSPKVVPGPVSPGAARIQESGRVISPPGADPDLTLCVFDWRVDGGIEYEVRLTSADGKYNLKRYGPIPINGDQQKYFAEFFGGMENIPLDSMEQRLAAQGSRLFRELMPEDLRKTLWSLRDSVSSIMVQSEEGTIPWELCKLYGEENGKIVEGPFLCEAYAISRWVPETDFRFSLTADNVALVVPGDSNLPSAAEEKSYMHSLNGSRTITDVPATYAAVYTELAAGRYDVWHFTGHGLAEHATPDRSKIALEGGDAFSPEDLSGVVSNLGQSQPIVFLNACQSSVGGASLTGVGGWGRRFVDAGAGAFVGTYWSVSDSAAAEFAECFYDAVLSGKGVADAVKSARLAIKDSPGPTWLAYTVMAHPLAATGK
jgi:hypothetical protein